MTVIFLYDGKSVDVLSGHLLLLLYFLFKKNNAKQNINHSKESKTCFWRTLNCEEPLNGYEAVLISYRCLKILPISGVETNQRGDWTL